MVFFWGIISSHYELRGICSMDNVRWALIGCGDVTEVKSGPGLYKSTGSSLIGVYNRTYDKSVDFAKRHNVGKVYREVEDLFTDEQVDIVYIATPPKYHHQYALQCLSAGKIPYIEKPVANTYEECLEIKSLSEKTGIPVYAAFYRRGVEKFLKIKELLSGNAIGNIRYITVNQTMPVEDSELSRDGLPWRVVPEISGGGKFLDMGVHVLDCLAMFFGEYEYMKGTACNQGGYYDAEDTVVATFGFKSGIVGSGTWCYVGDKSINQVQIVGEKGRIVYDGLSAKKFIIEKNGEQKLYTFDVPEHASMPYQQAIVNELIGKAKSEANFDQAINVVKMTDMMLETYRRGL